MPQAGIVGANTGSTHWRANNPYANTDSAAMRGLQSMLGPQAFAQQWGGQGGGGRGIGSKISAPTPTPVDPAIGQMLMQMMGGGGQQQQTGPTIIPGVNDQQTLMRMAIQNSQRNGMAFGPGSPYYDQFVASQQPQRTGPGAMGGGNLNINTGFNQPRPMPMPQQPPQQMQPGWIDSGPANFGPAPQFLGPLQVGGGGGGGGGLRLDPNSQFGQQYKQNALTSLMGRFMR